MSPKEYKSVLKDMINEIRNNNMDYLAQFSDEEILEMYPIAEKDVYIYVVSKKIMDMEDSLEELKEEVRNTSEQMRTGVIPPNEIPDYKKEQRKNEDLIGELKVKLNHLKEELKGVSFDERSNNR